jgi:hypothetical protein
MSILCLPPSNPSIPDEGVVHSEFLIHQRSVEAAGKPYQKFLKNFYKQRKAEIG